MAFLAQLRQSADKSVKAMTELAVSIAKGWCSKHAKEGRTELSIDFIPNRLAEQWAKEPVARQAELWASAVEEIKNALTSAGLSNVTVARNAKCFKVLAKWSGVSQSGESAYVASLNALVNTKHGEFCAKITDAFKTACMQKAQAGIMSAELRIPMLNGAPSYVNVATWKCAPQAMLMLRIRSECTQLGLPNVKMTTSGSADVLVISYEDTGHSASASDSNASTGEGVEVTGERSREERDRDLRKRSVDVEGTPSSSSSSSSSSSTPATDGNPGKRAKVELG